MTTKQAEKKVPNIDKSPIKTIIKSVAAYLMGCCFQLEFEVGIFGDLKKATQRY
jgi:hypothetical protein